MIRKQSETKISLNKSGIIGVFVLGTNDQELFKESLSTVEQYLFEKGNQSITLCINTIHYNTVHTLINKGYTVERTRIRMFFKKNITSKDSIDICSYEI